MVRYLSGGLALGKVVVACEEAAVLQSRGSLATARCRACVVRGSPLGARADRVGREREREGHAVLFAEWLPVAKDVVVARRRLDREPDGLEPADELADVLSHLATARRERVACFERVEAGDLEREDAAALRCDASGRHTRHASTSPRECSTWRRFLRSQAGRRQRRKQEHGLSRENTSSSWSLRRIQAYARSRSRTLALRWPLGSLPLRTRSRWSLPRGAGANAMKPRRPRRNPARACAGGGGRHSVASGTSPSSLTVPM